MKASAPRVRQAMLLAARKQAPQEDRLLRVALADPDPDVRRLAVQWAAEEKLTDLKPRVEAVLGGEGSQAGSLRHVTPDLFLATLAALAATERAPIPAGSNCWMMASTASTPAASTRVTVKPSRSRCQAQAAPMPVDAPVITTVCSITILPFQP